MALKRHASDSSGARGVGRDAKTGAFVSVGKPAEVTRFEKAADRFSQSSNTSTSVALGVLNDLGIATKGGNLTKHYRSSK